MEPAAVVPGFDPVTDSKAGFGAGAEHPPVDEFFLEGGQERFGRCVVPAHPGAAHRLESAVSSAKVGELAGGVLGAPVGVSSTTVDELAVPAAPEPDIHYQVVSPGRVVLSPYLPTP